MQGKIVLRCSVTWGAFLEPRMGGVCPLSVVGISYDFAIFAVEATSGSCDSRIFFFVVTCLAFIKIIVFIECYVRIVARDIVQPYGVMYYFTGLLSTHLTEPTVYGHTLIYVPLPG